MVLLTSIPAIQIKPYVTITHFYWKASITCSRPLRETEYKNTYDFQRKVENGDWIDYSTNITSDVVKGYHTTHDMMVQYRCRYHRPGFTSEWSEPSYLKTPPIMTAEIPGPTYVGVNEGHVMVKLSPPNAPEFLKLESNSIHMIYSTNKANIEVSCIIVFWTQFL